LQKFEPLWLSTLELKSSRDRQRARNNWSGLLQTKLPNHSTKFVNPFKLLISVLVCLQVGKLSSENHQFADDKSLSARCLLQSTCRCDQSLG